MTFIINPTNEDMLQIKCWAEPYNYNDAFHAFSHNRLFIVRKKDTCIAFMSYRFEQYDIEGHISLAEVEESYRNKGVGTYMLSQAINYFRRNGAMVVTLYAVNEGSERHALRNGFIHFSKVFDNQTWMMFPLCNVREQNFTSDFRLVVWDNVTGNTQGKPTMSWALDDDLFEKPILAYCHYDWTMAIYNNGEYIRIDKVKYFPIYDSESGFIYAEYLDDIMPNHSPTRPF